MLNINLRATYSNKQGKKLRFIGRKYRPRILKTNFFQAEDLSYLFFIRFFFLFNGSSLSFRHNRGRLRGLEFFSSLDIVKQKGKFILCRIRSCCHEWLTCTQSKIPDFRMLLHVHGTQASQNNIAIKNYYYYHILEIHKMSNKRPVHFKAYLYLRLLA